MAVVKPFRALRYDEAKAGPLESLVAPPYDVISAEQRAGYLEHPHNVVHLTLPDSAQQAGQTLERWRAEGVLVEEPPAVWLLVQDYVGPDGVERRRSGVVASLKVEPYETAHGAAARAHACGAEGGAPAAAPRDRRPARADLPPLRRAGARRSAGAGTRPRGRGREPLAARRSQRRARVRRQAAPDRGRPPSLRDRARLPRGGGNACERADARRARLDRGSRAGDLSDAPRLRRTPAASRASASRWPIPRSR